jgi:hypothetical protein
MFKTRNDLPEGARVKAVEVLNARLTGSMISVRGK